jgi:hypothetical protein
LFQQVFPEARIGDEKAIEFARRRYNRELYRDHRRRDRRSSADSGSLSGHCQRAALTFAPAINRLFAPAK